jgi:F0F1-type ATP synthase membrane subunit b/b'|tara:strand:- start:102 stop:251 length:150 start_codon:yes stop_codon:yes gene_type:complete
VLIGDLVIDKDAAELLETANDEVREDIEEAEEKKEEAKNDDENIKHTEN